MTRFVFRRAAAVLIAPRPGAPGRVANGSAFVVGLPSGPYLGTAWHVVSAWLKWTAEGEDLIFQVGGTALNPVERLVWKDETNDIAFLRLAEGEQDRIGISECEPVLGWPPPHPVVGSYVLVSGFPGIQRLRIAADEMDFGAFSTLLQVTAIHDRHLVCQFEREHWLSHTGRIPPPGTNLGGMSGGPVLLSKNLAYPLVGLVSEFSQTYELLFVKTLSHLPTEFS